MKRPLKFLMPLLAALMLVLAACNDPATANADAKPAGDKDKG